MFITTDYHLHTSFSSDSKEPMEAMIRRALDLGLTEICFTEHRDIDYPVPEDDPTLTFDLDLTAYEKKVREMQDKYKGKIAIKFGIECGLQPHIVEENKALIASAPFDFVLGSQHLCNHADPYNASYFDGKTDKEAYREFFEEIDRNIRLFDDFDVAAHLDYVVRVGREKDTHYHYEEHRELFREILSYLIAHGKGIEINTAGIRYGLKEPNPCSALIRDYKELGGEILTIGSDAHKAADMASHYQRVNAILEETGFRYITVFMDRKPSFLPLS